MHMRRAIASFWLLGLMNNIPYVIMIAGADEISTGGVGLVYFAQNFPSLLIKLTGPYWFHLTSYRMRLHCCSLMMGMSFLVVAFEHGNLPLQLVGVTLSGIQSGLGEASLLARTSFYHAKVCLTSWSSGTGFAGVAGYAWVILFTQVFHVSLSITLALALIFPLLFSFVYEYVLPKPLQKLHKNEDEEVFALLLTEDVSIAMHELTWKQRMYTTCTLWPYMLPLFLVYFAEYCMQTGPWSVIGFPVINSMARRTFYTHAGFAYQAGVFLSRSSGTLFQANRAMLFAMAIAQIALLGFFWCVAAFQFWYNQYLLFACFVVGLFGGAVYVNGFTLIAKETSSDLKEFALSAASVADTFGIMLADIVGLIIQGCLYSMYNIPGAKVHVSCAR